MADSLMTGLLKAVGSEVKTGLDVYFAPAKAVVRSVAAMAHSETPRFDTPAGGAPTEKPKVSE